MEYINRLINNGRFSEKNGLLHYTAFGSVWYGAKYSHRAWEQFAHTFEKTYVWLKLRSVNYLFMSLFWPLELDVYIYIYIYYFIYIYIDCICKLLELL